MKKILLLIFLTISFVEKLNADDIKNFEIEGISIGDSLLSHLSKDEIKAEIQANKSTYAYLTENFGEVYLYRDFKEYDRLSFFIKPKDENYTIYSIAGAISFDDKLNQCFAKQKEIEDQFSSIFTNAKKRKYSTKFEFDKSGESVSHNITFLLDTGDFFEVNCTKYKKSFKEKNNWHDSLQVTINRKEISEWFSNR